MVRSYLSHLLVELSRDGIRVPCEGVEIAVGHRRPGCAWSNPWVGEEIEVVDAHLLAFGVAVPIGRAIVTSPA